MLARSSLRSIITRRATTASARAFSRSGPRLAEAYKPSVSGGQSDIPWIIGSVAVTVPAAFFLLNSGSPKVKHLDPNVHKSDTASTSPGEVNKRSEANADESVDHIPSIAGDNEQGGAKDDSLKAYGERAVSEAKETLSNFVENPTEKAAELGEKTKESTKSAAEKVTEGTKNAVETVKGVGEQVKYNVKERSDEEGESRDPQKYDPGYTAMREPGGDGTMSGKQEGLSNSDTWHAVLHDERGEAIKKKAEGVHDSAKIKGTVDVNRPAK